MVFDFPCAAWGIAVLRGCALASRSSVRETTRRIECNPLNQRHFFFASALSRCFTPAAGGFTSILFREVRAGEMYRSIRWTCSGALRHASGSIGARAIASTLLTNRVSLSRHRATKGHVAISLEHARIGGPRNLSRSANEVSLPGVGFSSSRGGPV